MTMGRAVTEGQMPNVSKPVEKKKRSEVAMAIYQLHGYGKQWWSSQKGYTVECRCGREFLVGQIPDFVEPEESPELKALEEKDTGGELGVAEARQYHKLVEEWADKRRECLAQHEAEERKLLAAPILKHVQELFEKALD